MFLKAALTAELCKGSGVVVANHYYLLKNRCRRRLPTPFRSTAFSHFQFPDRLVYPNPALTADRPDALEGLVAEQVFWDPRRLDGVRGWSGRPAATIPAPVGAPWR